MFAASPHLVVPAIATVVPVTIAAVVLVGLRSRRDGSDPGTTLWRTSLVAYLGALVAVTFFPFVIDLDAPPDSPWRPMMNLDALSSLHLRSFWLNIVMTVPLGAYLTGHGAGRRGPAGRGPAGRGPAGRGRADHGPSGRRRLRGIVPVAVLALLASASVELLQLALHLTIGGNRATDVDDVIANTAGAVVGALLWRAVLLVGRAARAGRSHQAARASTRASTQEAAVETAHGSRRRPHPSDPLAPVRASEGARGS
jgi:glycopeptide antibiotics resistance protein